MEKTTRPFRYDLNQITYDYTAEVRNRFKGLDLIDRVPDELWMEGPDIVQEKEIKTISKKKKYKTAKWLSEEALQIAMKRRESESEVTQSCPTLCNPVGCSPPGSSVHGILQARILEWVAISFSRGIFPTQGSNPGLPHCRQML